jgi:hypothetical protein
MPEDELGGESVTWSAAWGLQDDDFGTEDSDEDLRRLVSGIVDDARQWTGRYALTIEWDISGDAPEGQTVEDMIAETGVTLPEIIEPT